MSLPAQDSAGAILRSDGGVFLNKHSAPPSAAIYRDDLIETQKNAIARIEAAGVTVNVNPETMVQFESDELSLDHGSLSISTSSGLKVRIGCVLVTPVNASDWTRYEVVDLDGKVNISAVKGEVIIESRISSRHPAKQPSNSVRTTLHEGERQSRDEKCDAKEVKEPDRLPGIGAILNSPWAIGTGAVAIGVLTCWALCRSSAPLSPDSPSSNP